MGQFEKNGGMHNCESSSSKDHRNAGGEREIDGPDRSAPWEKCMLIKFRNFILHYERCGWGRGMQRATMVATKISSLKSLTAPRYTEAEGCGRTLTGINRLAEWQVGWKPPEWSERSKVVSRIEIVRSRIASCPTVRPWSHRWKKVQRPVGVGLPNRGLTWPPERGSSCRSSMNHYTNDFEFGIKIFPSNHFW